MFRVLKTTLVNLRCLKRGSVSSSSLSNGLDWTAELPHASYSSVTVNHFSDTQNSFLRAYSTAKGAGLSLKRRNDSEAGPYSIVEPLKKEEFLFLDLDDLPQNKEAEHDHLHSQELVNSVKTKEQKERKNAENRNRGLEMQLKHMKESFNSTVEENTCIEFHDEGFSMERHSKPKKIKKHQHKTFGTPDVEVPVSESCCSGCGALMHCTDPEIPGYLPSEKFKALLEEDQLSKAICQRCFLITHHQKALNISMSKEEYRAVVRGIKSEKALVLLIVDLLDIPDSIISDLPELVGQNKRIVILGNKIDLLPGDSENYLQRIRRQLASYCASMGISVLDKKDIHLISAKTGYGIESLISRIQSFWKYKGDVYLVGTANAGKSTLFNTLLESDFCKSRASDVIHKATISPWPGTTLNLLKFPIINPTPYRMHRRTERLQQASLLTEEDLSPQELLRIKQFSKEGYLVGHIGRTFRANRLQKKMFVEFDPDSLSFGEDMDEESDQKSFSEASAGPEFTYNEIKNANWFYDTPGIMKDNDILSILSEQEVKQVVPTQAITPRTFVLKPGMVLFLGGLVRIDYLEGENSCWLTVVASSKVPVHITSLEKADEVYQKHAGNTLLAVPAGGDERMKNFPPLIPQDFHLQGQGFITAVTDIKISSAGWIAVTAPEGHHVSLRAHAPEAAGLCLRSPPLLPHIVSLKGERIRKTPAYKTKKPQALVDTGLSAKAAERLNVRIKK